MPEARAVLRQPWWRTALPGFALTLLFLGAGLWQLGVLAAGVAGYLSRRGRDGAYRGIEAVAPAWILWLLASSLVAPVDDVAVLLGGIVGGGWGLIVLLIVLVPVLLGLFGGMAAGYLAEVLSPGPREADAAPPPPGLAP